MKAVHVIGSAHWDYLARANAMPGPGDDLPGRIVRRPGGVALNLASVLAQNGVAVELFASVGRDEAGDALVRAIEERRIGTRHLHRGAQTDRYIAIEGPDGGLFAAVADDRALQLAGAALVQNRPVAETSPAVVVDGNLPSPAAAALAAQGAQAEELCFVSASPAKAARFRALVETVGTAAGHDRVTLFANLAEAAALEGQSFDTSLAAARSLSALCGTAVVTNGASAAALATVDGTAHTARPPDAQGSTLGAGDAFVGGFLACRLLHPTRGLDGQFQAGFAAAARSMEGLV